MTIDPSAAPSRPVKLLLWQKRQAALIHHFTSFDFLKELQRRFDQLLGETDAVVDLATRQGRDQVLEDPRWGHRDTVDNWANNGAWGAMKDMQFGFAKAIAMRAFEVYYGSGMYELSRMLGEFSTFWMTPDEEKSFKERFEALYSFASPMDTILRSRKIDYSDYYFWWRDHGHLFQRLPKFRIRTDVIGESGKVPPRTGVYVAQGDPNAGLQFGWTGGDEGYHWTLPDAQTFNEIGLHAVNFVGREHLWFDEARMDEFAMLPQYRGILTFDDPPIADWMKLSRKGIVARPCKWYYVEQVHGEWDDEGQEPVAQEDGTLRALPGEVVPRAGTWLTPALPPETGRLELQAGERLPPTRFTEWGEVIWYWRPESQRS